jgi:uncharacterized protein (DUF2141 family)
MKHLIILVTLISYIYAYDLEVEVDNLRNSKGDVLFSLYDKEGSLPDENFKKFYKQKKANIINNSAKIVFHNLDKRRYAVNILHDENKNNKIDKGFMLPIEGVGLSNFKTINLFHKPNFKKASFLLDKNKKINITAIYF